MKIYFDLGVENEALRGKLGEVDEKWLSESKTRINYLMMVREKIDSEKMKKDNHKN